MGARFDAIAALAVAATNQTQAAKDISRYKTEQAVAAFTASPVEIPIKGTQTATIKSVEALPNNDGVRLTVAVFDAGKDVTPPDLNPWIVLNPPMLVEDAAGDVQIAAMDRDGKAVTRTFREDPAAVLVDIVRRGLS